MKIISIEEKVKEIIAYQAGISRGEISDQEELRNLMDSLKIIELEMECEELLELEIKFRETPLIIDDGFVEKFFSSGSLTVREVIEKMKEIAGDL